MSGYDKRKEEARKKRDRKLRGKGKKALAILCSEPLACECLRDEDHCHCTITQENKDDTALHQAEVIKSYNCQDHKDPARSKKTWIKKNPEKELSEPEDVKPKVIKKKKKKKKKPNIWADIPVPTEEKYPMNFDCVDNGGPADIADWEMLFSTKNDGVKATTPEKGEAASAAGQNNNDNNHKPDHFVFADATSDEDEPVTDDDALMSQPVQDRTLLGDYIFKRLEKDKRYADHAGKITGMLIEDHIDVGRYRKPHILSDAIQEAQDLLLFGENDSTDEEENDEEDEDPNKLPEVAASYDGNAIPPKEHVDRSRYIVPGFMDHCHAEIYTCGENAEETSLSYRFASMLPGVLNMQKVRTSALFAIDQTTNATDTSLAIGVDWPSLGIHLTGDHLIDRGTKERYVNHLDSLGLTRHSRVVIYPALRDLLLRCPKLGLTKWLADDGLGLPRALAQIEAYTAHYTAMYSDWARCAEIVTSTQMYVLMVKLVNKSRGMTALPKCVAKPDFRQRIAIQKDPTIAVPSNARLMIVPTATNSIRSSRRILQLPRGMITSTRTTT
jgi:hypothetical protein